MPDDRTDDSMRDLMILGRYEMEPLVDHGASSGVVTAHFGDIEPRLIEFIDKSEIVVGCVAWLTSEPIICALSKKQCQIVVQKEDFLRPDTGANPTTWPRKLRSLYDLCGLKIDRYYCPSPLCRMNICSDGEMECIRCVGYRSPRGGANPRSHHKFIVRCCWYESPGCRFLRPLAVWTGSYNFTKNATKSFENAVEIVDEGIADAYLHEWAQIAGLSETLDWEYEWASPQWMIGS